MPNAFGNTKGTQMKQQQVLHVSKSIWKNLTSNACQLFLKQILSKENILKFSFIAGFSLRFAKLKIMLALLKIKIISRVLHVYLSRASSKDKLLAIICLSYTEQKLFKYLFTCNHMSYNMTDLCSPAESDVWTSCVLIDPWPIHYKGKLGDNRTMDSFLFIILYIHTLKYSTSTQLSCHTELQIFLFTWCHRYYITTINITLDTLCSYLWQICWLHFRLLKVNYESRLFHTPGFNKKTLMVTICNKNVFVLVMKLILVCL